MTSLALSHLAPDISPEEKDAALAALFEQDAEETARDLKMLVESLGGTISN